MTGFLRRVRRWLRREPAAAIDVDEVMRAFEQLHQPKPPTPRAPKVSKRTVQSDSCPTPRKVKYASLSAAKAHRSWKSNKGARMRAYKCPCGSWHLARRES